MRRLHLWLLFGLLACALRAGVSAEPTVTAVNRAHGIVEITITSEPATKPAVYRLDLSKHHEPAREKTPLIAKWESYRFGAFVCFNSNQFSGSEHCKAKDPSIYSPTDLDVAGWIAALKQAGMKYAVLTVRHTSDFLLWPSATSRCTVAGSKNTTDVVGALVAECRRQGIAPGFYYCMWGGQYKPHPNARAIILAQLYELATRYGPIPYFWIDMMHWAPADLSIQEVYDALKTLQPESVVIFNQHVQDGTELVYFPTDAVNGELWPPPPEGHNPRRIVNGVTYYLPFEYEPVSQQRPGGIPYDPLGPSCWFTYGEGCPPAPSHTFTAEAMYRRIMLARDRGASNVLLSTAPDHTGRMRPADVQELVKLGQLLRQPPQKTLYCPELIDQAMSQSLRTYLQEICDWAMTLDVGSGQLKNTKDTPWSIFINGNFARLLLAAHKITGKPEYRAEALRWCDTLVGQQQEVVTSQGHEAGYWADAGTKGNIYLADAGTAATALALGCRYAEPERKQRYLDSLRRFALFVREGCREDPQGQGRGGSPGWVIQTGKDRGALGCGYYRGHLSTAPYIISSGTNAGAMFASLYALENDAPTAEIASGAVRWMLAHRQPDGQLPYIIDGEKPSFERPLCTMTHCGEGIIAAYTHIRNRQLRAQIAAGVRPCIQWLLETQGPDGLWGKAHSFDQQRSPGVITLLAWYYRTIDPDPRIAQAVRNYCRCLLVRDNSQRYGVRELVRTTGFVGLAVAELLVPGVTFK